MLALGRWALWQGLTVALAWPARWHGVYCAWQWLPKCRLSSPSAHAVAWWGEQEADASWAPA